MVERHSNILNSFVDLVQIDSPTFHEEKMAKAVYARLVKLGFEPKIDKEGNVVAKLSGDSSKETLMLNAHLDTVQKIGEHVEPYIDSMGWVRSKGNTILGADNKTSVAAILETLHKLKKEKSKIHHPLEIVFTVSEESGNHGAHGLDYSKLKAKRGYIFDASDREFGTIILSSPAYARFDIRVLGVPSHASKPELAKNILPSFARALANTKLGWRDSKRTLVNIGIVSVGQQGGPVNTVPGELIVSGEVRTMDGRRVEKIAREVSDKFKKEAAKDGCKTEIKIVKENGSFEFDRNDEFVKRTVKVLQNMGVKPGYVNSWGCYEANIFAEHGIMMLNLADGALDSHTNNERIRVSDLELLGELAYKLVTE